MDVITPPHHCTAPPNSTTRSRKITPHRLERQMQVEAGMCRKSRDGQNTAKTDAKCDTHRKTPNKNDAKWRAEHVFGQCSPPVVAFFARKHRKYRRENKTQVQFRASKVPKLEFQHMPAKKSTHPAQRQTHVLPTTTIVSNNESSNNDDNKKQKVAVIIAITTIILAIRVTTKLTTTIIVAVIVIVIVRVIALAIADSKSKSKE